MPRIFRTLIPILLIPAFCTIVYAGWRMNPHTGKMDYYQKADEMAYDNSTSGMTADDMQAAVDELYGLIGSSNTAGLNWTSLAAQTDTSGLDSANFSVVWGTGGATKKMTGAILANWIQALSPGISDGDKGDIVVSGSGAAWNIEDGDKGSITVSSSGDTWTLDDATITAAKMANADHGDVAWSGGTATVQAATGSFSVGTNLDVAGQIQAGSGNHDLTNAAGLIDGEKIQDDTIDDDSIDFSDVTLADITFDVGSVDTTEFGYLNGVTSAIQTQLDARCLESVFGTALDASQLAVTSNSLGIISGGVTTTEILNNTISATDLAAALTFADGDLIDLSGVTMSAGADEGIALPTYADVAPATEKYYMAYSAADNAIFVRESGGWVNASAGSGAATTLNFVTTQAEGSLSTESVLTAGEGIDITDAGGDGGALTVAGEDATSSNKGIASFSTDNFTVSSGAVTIKDGGVAAAELASADFGVFTVATGVASLDADTVNATHIDWGTGANQIDVSDIEAVGSVNILLETEIDASSELATLMDDETGSGSLVFANTPTLVTPVLGAATGTSLALGTDPADTGTIRMANAEYIYAEAAPAGTDISVIGVSSDEIVQIGASGASGVTITPATTITGALTASSTISAAGNVTLDDGTGASPSFTMQDATDETAVFSKVDAGYLTITTVAGDGVNILTGNMKIGNGTPTTTPDGEDLYVEGNTEIDGTLDVAGNITTAGSITSSASGDSYLQLSNNTTIDPSGNRIYFEGNELTVSENGDEDIVLTQDDSATCTGTSWDFSAVTNFEIPNGAAPTTDAFGEMASDNNAWATGRGAIQTYDGTANTWLVGTLTSDTPSNGQVPKWNTGGTITWEDDLNAGSPTINDIADATAAADINFDISETMTWNFTGNYTTGSQFLIEQKTGDPSGGTLFEVKAADANTVAASIGDGMNKVNFSNTGAVTLGGTASIAAGGITLGDSSPDANGEVGYASNAYTLFANSEDLSVTAGSNLWTLASSTSATFAFTPAVAMNGGLTTTDISYTGTLTPPAVADPEAIWNSLASTDWQLWADDSASEMILAYGATDTMACKWNTTGIMTLKNGETLDNSTDGTIKTSGDFEITGADLTLAAAGVKLTGSNGALTILGLGDGQNEDVKIDLNSTANTIEITSPASSATAVDFNTLNLITTGTITGKVNMVTIDSARAITSAECQGSFIMITSAGTYSLPAAATAGYGSTVCIYVRDASETVIVEVDNADKISLNGTALDAGDTIDSAGAAGDFISLISTTDADGSGTDGWRSLGRSGVWTDGGAT